jgi:diguanylate cyclase (GGDEF)-like protein
MATETRTVGAGLLQPERPMTLAKCSLLVVDDEPNILTSLALLLAKDFEILTADSAETAQRIFGQRDIDLVLSDQRLPGLTGVQLLEWVRENSPKTVRLLMTGLARLEDAVEAINCGQISRFVFKPWHADELVQVLHNAARTFLLERSHEQLLEELRNLNLELEERVQQRTRELQEANHQLQRKNWMLEKLALTDPLTGLPNRRAMDHLAKAELRRRTRYPSALALGLVDVDHFKEINARYLLPGGDQVLIGLSKTLVSSVRTVDGVGRIGGEEFQVVAPETNREGALVLSERIRTAIENSRYSYKGEAIQITASLGFAVADVNVASDYDQLRHIAAAALAEAKNTGRNRSVIRCAEAPLDQVG